MSKNGKEREDLQYEGKDEVFMDVDRFINEGMSGGSVHRFHGSTNIEEAREFVKEDPPTTQE